MTPQVLPPDVGFSLAGTNSPSYLAPTLDIERSQLAFEKVLDELLINQKGKWVAFAKGQFVRLGKSHSELYQYCLNDLGLKDEEFIVRRVIPQINQQIETPI